MERCDRQHFHRLCWLAHFRHRPCALADRMVPEGEEQEKGSIGRPVGLFQHAGFVSDIESIEANH